MFTPTLQMSNKGQPLEKRIENCRGRITELEKQLGKVRISRSFLPKLTR